MTSKPNRRTFLQSGLAFTSLALFPGAAAMASPTQNAARIKVPADGVIKVAFLLSANANVIDTAGPWEVFQDAMLHEGENMKHPFNLYTVAEGTEPLSMTGGLTVLPKHSFADAPQPHVIVVPAQRGSKAGLEWLKASFPKTDVTMSVCTGAFQLARAGLLKGMNATTHHDFWDAFATNFPDVKLQRGLRFVDNGKIATAGGLTSGFDMALHVVERYLGPEAAKHTAEYMEYQRERGGAKS